jgi:N-acetylmuramoyl-L-alanine amidase
VIARPCSALVTRLCPSPNIEPRRDGVHPDILLLHYTGMRSCAGAIDWLSRPESRVSCHYVVDVDGMIVQMVAEDMRAWHAGVSCWDGISDINSRSIGIEIHNPGHDLGYPEFPAAQMEAVARLSLDIVQRWRIPPPRVLAHSDVAPARKNDPGEKLDWAWLASKGVGHWVEPAVADTHIVPAATAADTTDRIRRAQQLLRAYGYDIAATGEADRQTELVVTAFQRHFRPALVDGVLDDATLDTLERLIAALARA